MKRFCITSTCPPTSPRSTEPRQCEPPVVDLPCTRLPHRVHGMPVKMPRNSVERRNPRGWGEARLGYLAAPGASEPVRQVDRHQLGNLAEHQAVNHTVSAADGHRRRPGNGKRLRASQSHGNRTARPLRLAPDTLRRSVTFLDTGVSLPRYRGQPRFSDEAAVSWWGLAGGDRRAPREPSTTRRRR